MLESDANLSIVHLTDQEQAISKKKMPINRQWKRRLKTRCYKLGN